MAWRCRFLTARRRRRPSSWTVWKSKFYDAFVLNHRVVLHVIDAMPDRWRGDAGSSPLDLARAATSSPRNDFVKNCRVHPTHWLISTQVMEARPTMDLPRTIARVLDLPLRGTLEKRPWWEALVWPRGAGTDVLLRSHPVWKS